MKNLKGSVEVLSTFKKFLDAGALTMESIKETAKAQKINVPPSVQERLMEKNPDLAKFAEELGIVGKARASAAGSGDGRTSNNFALLSASNPQVGELAKALIEATAGKSFDVTLPDGQKGTVVVQIAFKRTDALRPTRADKTAPASVE